MSMPTLEEMQSAVATRDHQRDGDFYYGVVTTGAFCKPSCSSRAAKKENLRFFDDIESAMTAGYRPCKRCQPTQGRPHVSRLEVIARYIEKHADEQLTLATLGEQANLSPSRLQRIFKSAFGISPKAFQDAVRMRHFKESLQHGESITDAIHSSGYGSISRIYGEASRNIGMTPKSYRAKGKDEVIHYSCRNTEMGLLMMAATKKGVCFVQFGDDEDSLLSLLQREFSNAELRPTPTRDNHQLDLWMKALSDHIQGSKPRPDLPLDIRGTAFQMKVWQFLLSIKEGDVLSYGEVAEGINHQKAVRAVGTACGKNQIAILIPCHRVLRGDGSLGGYRWGLERKRVLLEKEKAGLQKS